MQTVICLMGPTASGKTQLAVSLTQRFPCEIISVDSAMVYRGMDIGTAKPDADILKLAPHRLIDIRDPSESYSAAEFRNDALREIADILEQKKIPLLVGGTMLYFRALQGGLSDLPSAEPRLREELYQEAETLGWQALHRRLEQVDPKAAERIHPNDPQRIARALEVYTLTGKSLTAWQEDSPSLPTSYRMLNIAVAPLQREILHQRIAERFTSMLAAGFMEEMKRLFARADLNLQTPAMRAVGYRQAWEHLQGDYGFEEMRERAVIATRQLAKRQLTWLRSWQALHWFDSESIGLEREVDDFLMQQLSL